MYELIYKYKLLFFFKKSRSSTLELMYYLEGYKITS